MPSNAASSTNVISQGISPDLTENQILNFQALLQIWKSQTTNFATNNLKYVASTLENLKWGEFGDLLFWISDHVLFSEQAAFITYLTRTYVASIAELSIVHKFHHIPGVPAWTYLKGYLLGKRSRDVYIAQFPSLKALLNHTLLQFGGACLRIYCNAVNSVPEVKEWDIVAQRKVEAEFALKDLDAWGLKVDPSVRACLPPTYLD